VPRYSLYSSSVSSGRGLPAGPQAGTSNRLRHKAPNSNVFPVIPTLLPGHLRFGSFDCYHSAPEALFPRIFNRSDRSKS
jgi:hypothetical protein